MTRRDLIQNICGGLGAVGLTAMLEQQGQDLERLIVKLDFDAVLAQLS